MSGLQIPAVGETWPGFGHVRCCEKDWGGSHYHCARCGEVAGSYGHFVTLRPGNDLSERFADRIGVDLPFEGFTCDPHGEADR